MKKLAVLLLAALALGWGALAIDVGGDDTTNTAPGVTPADEGSEPQSSHTRAGRAPDDDGATGTRTQETGRTARASATDTPSNEPRVITPSSHVHPPTVAPGATPAEDEPVAADLPGTRPGPEERPEDPRFHAMASLYAAEPRDGPWALRHERRIMALLERGEDPRGLHVHCRTTVCRLTVERGSPQDLEDILARPGVREATLLDESSPYAFEAGAFTLYYRRIGDPPENEMP